MLRTQIAWLQQQLFGPGKSEKLDRAQLLLKLGELEKLAAASAPTQTISYERTVRQGKSGRCRPRTLRTCRCRRRSSSCRRSCGLSRRLTKESARSGPSRWTWCRPNSSSARLCARSLNAGMIARSRRWWRRPRPAPWPAVTPPPDCWPGSRSSKYVDHLPLYRLEQMSSRWGATLPRSSMADWIGITAQWLEPIYRQMKSGLLQGGYVPGRRDADPM